MDSQEYVVEVYLKTCESPVVTRGTWVASTIEDFNNPSKTFVEVMGDLYCKSEIERINRKKIENPKRGSFGGGTMEL